jgi:hypothetical protein
VFDQRRDGKKFLLEVQEIWRGRQLGTTRSSKVSLGHHDRWRGFRVLRQHKSIHEGRQGISLESTELIDGNQLVRMMFESKPAAGGDDSYQSMFLQCEEIVYHRLRAPQSARCPNGHEIEPTLTLELVLSASE